MLMQPISIEIHDGAAYVRYSNVSAATTIDLIPTAEVAADVDSTGALVGIEVLDIIDAEQLSIAAAYATHVGAAFPRDLSGSLTSA